MRNAIALLQIIRPFNAVMAFIAVWIGYWLSIGVVSFSLQALFLAIAVFLISSGGQAINDFFDWKIDARQKPNRPIPSHDLERNEVLIYSIVLFAIGIILSFFVNFWAFVIAIVFSLLLIVYSALMNEIKFIGNWVVAFSSAFTFVFGSLVSFNYLPALFPFVVSLLASVSREVTKDLEEIHEHDKVTLPKVIGEQFSKIVIACYLSVAVVLSYYPIFFKAFTSPFYFIFISMANILFIAAVYSTHVDNFKQSQEIQKLAMFIALIAFVLAIFK